MPRVTRAALRLEQHEETDIAASTPLPQTPIKGRIPLGEVPGNKGTHSEVGSTSEEQAAPTKKAIGKGKKGNNAKKANKQKKDNAIEVHAEVLEDISWSVHSSAAEEACQDLLRESSPGMLNEILSLDCMATNSCQSMKSHPKSSLMMVDHRPHLRLPPTQLVESYHQSLQHNI